MHSCLEKLEDSNEYNFAYHVIKDGNVPEKSLACFYELFSDRKFSEYYELKTTFLMSILKNSSLFDKKLFSEAFGCDVDNFQILFNLKKRSFPVYDKKNGEISTVYIFETENKNFPVTFPNTDKQVIKILEDIKHIVNKDFFVCFSKYFSGNSFGLAVASGFFVDDEFADIYTFTGDVKADGSIQEVSFVPEKKELASEEGKFLISFENFKHTSELGSLNTNELHVPFVQLFGKPKSVLTENLQKLYRVTSGYNLIKAFGIDTENLFVYSQNNLENDIETWKDYFEQAFRSIDFFKAFSPKITVHYLLSVSAFAFPLGIRQGALNKTAVYHFQNGEIFKVFDFVQNDLRNVKKKKREYTLIDAKYTEIDSHDMCIAIYVASHNPKKDAEEFAVKTLKANFLYITTPDFQGKLPADEPEIWTKTVAELYSKIDETANNACKNITHYHFIFSTPVPVAFVLGMAIGDYKKISVYNFDKSTTSYKKVFST